jgi:aspartate ammonia-lyase
MTAVASPTPAAALAERLRATTFLAGLPDAHVWRLSRAMTVEHYDEGSTLFEEAAPRRYLFVVLAGSVAVEKAAEGRAVRLSTFGAGEAIGEGLLLGDTAAHGTTARALSSVTVAVLTRAAVEDLIKEAPPAYAALVARAARSIAARLRAADATLVGHGRTTGFAGGGVRKERDLLGERDVPSDALYGVQTLRALENFPITGVALREFPALVSALATVKAAAARANAELGLLAPEAAEAIERAADEVREGRHHEHFLVDMIQGGRRHVEQHERQRGHRQPRPRAARPQPRRLRALSPNTHVNLSQSTNDVYPTALKLALHESIDGCAPRCASSPTPSSPRGTSSSAS